jgi:hypothetical protein
MPIDILASTPSTQTPFSSGNITIDSNILTQTVDDSSQVFSIQTSGNSLATFSVVPIYRIGAYLPGN